MDETALRAEARYLNRFLFRAPLAPEVETHYVRAHSAGAVTEIAKVDVVTIVTRGLDAGAIELALRRTNPLNLLTQKMCVLVYLAEARSDAYDSFVLERDRRFVAFVRMAFGVVRSVVKLLRGLYLTRVYRLV
jgi:hypothetical protein